MNLRELFAASMLAFGGLAFGGLAFASVGCTSLARGGAAATTPDSTDDDDDHLGSLPVTANASVQTPAGPPGQMDVAWTDNGIPIRQLTGPGAPQEMKVPESHPKQTDQVPPANASVKPAAKRAPKK